MSFLSLSVAMRNHADGVWLQGEIRRFLKSDGKLAFIAKYGSESGTLLMTEYESLISGPWMVVEVTAILHIHWRL